MARLATPCTVQIQKNVYTVSFLNLSKMFEFTPFPKPPCPDIRLKTEAEVTEMLRKNKIIIISSILDELKWPQVDTKI